jgi:hypothetical protein
VNGSVVVHCLPASGSTFPFGVTTVNCGATNAQNNTTTHTFTVTVQDTTAPAVPVLISPANGSPANAQPTYAWNSSPDAGGTTSYGLQRDSSGCDFVTDVTTIPNLGGVTSFTSAAALADGTYCWRVQARDRADNASGYSAPFTFTVGTPTPHVLLPGDGSSVAGSSYFVSDAPAAATRVEFRVSGPAGPDVALGDAVFTQYGWFMLRSLAALPEGTYSLTTVSHFGAVSVTSAPTTFSIDRTKPATTVIVPAADGTTLHGASGVLDASATDNVGVTRVEFRLTGGAVQNQLIGNATLSYFGWISIWNTATVPNGTYKLRSVAFDAAGNTQTSAPRTIKIAN